MLAALVKQTGSQVRQTGACLNKWQQSDAYDGDDDDDDDDVITDDDAHRKS